MSSAFGAAMQRALFGLFVLVGCAKQSTGDFVGTAPPPSAASPRTDPSARADAPAEEADASTIAGAPQHRQALGTEYGESRHSTVTTVPFVRASDRPDVTLALLYDDIEGVKNLARANGSFARTESSMFTADGTFVLNVVDENGQLLVGADIANKRYAIGSAGQRYSLGIENHSDQRFEVVASVDGLDVIDGDDAGFHKRGYVLEPFTSVMIDGWRTSDETVAAFRFGTVADSYAERRGKGRNVGVIGAAFFHERGGVAWQDLGARPVQQSRFAPPPPPRRF